MRAERLAGMCLLSGESASPPFCWAGENCSGFMFDVRAEELWDSYLRRAQRREGAKVDFFALRVRARHLELGHFSKKKQE